MHCFFLFFVCLFFLRLFPGITLKCGRSLSFYEVKIDLKDRLFIAFVVNATSIHETSAV